MAHAEYYALFLGGVCAAASTILVVVIAKFRSSDKNRDKKQLMPSHLQIVHRPNYKLKPFANSDRDTGMTITCYIHLWYCEKFIFSNIRSTLLFHRRQDVLYYTPYIIFKTLQSIFS